MLCTLLREIYSSRPTSAKCLSTLIRVPTRHDRHCRPQSAIRNKPPPASGPLLVVNICPAFIEDISHIHICFLDSTRVPYVSPNWPFPAVRHKRKNGMTLHTATLWHNFTICLRSLNYCGDQTCLWCPLVAGWLLRRSTPACYMVKSATGHDRQVTALHL